MGRETVRRHQQNHRRRAEQNRLGGPLPADTPELRLTEEVGLGDLSTFTFASGSPAMPVFDLSGSDFRSERPDHSMVPLLTDPNKG